MTTDGEFSACTGWFSGSESQSVTSLIFRWWVMEICGPLVQRVIWHLCRDWKGNSNGTCGSNSAYFIPACYWGNLLPLLGAMATLLGNGNPPLLGLCCLLSQCCCPRHFLNLRKWILWPEVLSYSLMLFNELVFYWSQPSGYTFVRYHAVCRHCSVQLCSQCGSPADPWPPHWDSLDSCHKLPPPSLFCCKGRDWQLCEAINTWGP